MLENKLNELNIFALRDLARKMGVASPTSKKKEELIKHIKEIMSGEKKPEAGKSKQGRPPKVFGYDFMNMLHLDNVTNLAKMTLNQNVTPYQNEDIVTVAGWLELVNNNSAILWVQKDFKIEHFFISNEILKNYNVKMGDRVVAEVEMNGSQWVVKNIFNINGCPVLKFPNERIDYSQISHVISSKKLSFANDVFNDLNLNVAENVYVYGTNNNNNTIKIVEMLNSCKIENKLYVNVSIADKNKIYLNNLSNCEKFIANILDEASFVRRLICLAVERAKRILESGEDVLLVVDDLVSIMGVDKDGLSLVKNIVSLAKQGENMGSITVLAVVPNVSLSQIEKLADKRLKVEDEKIFKVD